MINTIKFSEFINGGFLNSDDTLVGLQGGLNAQFTAFNSPIEWTVANSTQVMTENTGYIVNSTSLVVLTLPPVSTFSSIISIVGMNTGGWEIVQTTGQSIVVSPLTTTVTSGSLASTHGYDSINLIC